jgi:ABC-type Na+ transport system ATPase subunit NatA
MGEIYLNGRVSALIELGAGFHPELTGRENIYLNGTILGLTRRQINDVLPAIIDFAELREFIDTPVNRYSSGMYARLGFSIAVHVDPDILLVDEVLSVGDYAFQQKSLDRMLSFRKQAKAMVFVSHNLAAVQSLCDKVIWLEQGQIRLQGPPIEVISIYQRESLKRGHTGEVGRMKTDQIARGVWIVSVMLRDGEGNSVEEIYPNDPLSVMVELECSGIEHTKDLVIGVAIYNHQGMKCGEATNIASQTPIRLRDGRNIVTVHFPHVPLAPGDYYINIGVAVRYLVQLAHAAFAASFQVASLPGRNIHGPIYFDADWQVNSEFVD